MNLENKPYSILKFEIKNDKYIEVYLNDELIKKIKLKKIKNPYFIPCSDILKSIRAVYKSFQEIELYIYKETLSNYELKEIISDCSKTIKYLYEYDMKITKARLIDKIINFLIFKII